MRQTSLWSPVTCGVDGWCAERDGLWGRVRRAVVVCVPPLFPGAHVRRDTERVWPYRCEYPYPCVYVRVKQAGERSKAAAARLLNMKPRPERCRDRCLKAQRGATRAPRRGRLRPPKRKGWQNGKMAKELRGGCVVGNSHHTWPLSPSRNVRQRSEPALVREQKSRHVCCLATRVY